MKLTALNNAVQRLSGADVYYILYLYTCIHTYVYTYMYTYVRTYVRTVCTPYHFICTYINI